MRFLKFIKLLFLANSSIFLFGQSPQVLNNVNQINWQTAALPTVVNVSVNQIGSGGTSTYYYWVIAKFSNGNASPSNPAIAYNSNNFLSSTNYNLVSWSAVAGATAYDVLRTTSANLPSTGSGSILVGTVYSGASFSDVGGGLSSYTINTFSPTGTSCAWTISNGSYINLPCLNAASFLATPNPCAISSGTLPSIVCLEYTMANLDATDTTDNTALIKADITKAGAGTYKVPNGVYKISVGDIILPSTVRIEGVNSSGTSFDCSSLPTTTPIACFAVAGQSSLTQHGGLSKVTIIGPGLSFSNVYGIYVGADPNNVITPVGSQAASCIFDQVNIVSFGSAYYFGNNTWKDDFLQNYLALNGTGINYPTTYNNAGEGMTFIGGSIFDNTIGALLNGGAPFSFQGTSFDYNGNAFTGTYPLITITGSNIEQASGTLGAWNPTGGTGYAGQFNAIGCIFAETATTGSDVLFSSTNNAMIFNIIGGSITANHAVSYFFSGVTGGFYPNFGPYPNISTVNFSSSNWSNITWYNGGIPSTIGVNASGFTSLPVNGPVYPNQNGLIVAGSVSGAVAFQQPFSGTYYKVVMIYLSALNGTASYTFPQAWSKTPGIFASSTTAASVVTSLSNTSVTVTGSTTTGFVILMGY